MCRVRRIVAIGIALSASIAFAAKVEAAPHPNFIRLTVREDGSSQSLVGVLESENDQEVKFFDFKTRQGRAIKRENVASLRKHITAQEVANVVGVAPFVAWEIRQLLPANSGRTARIAALDLGAIYVSLGKEDGIREGEELQVYRGELEIKDPETGKVLGKQRRKLARLQVTEVQEKLSKAKLLGDIEVQLRVGDAVRATNAEKPVAVLPFADESGDLTRGGLALTDQLIGELVHESVPTVERTRLAQVLAELALQNTALFDAKTQQQIGKQVGAFALITGSVIPMAKGRRSQVTVRMTDVQSGSVLYGSTYQVATLDSSRTSPSIGSVAPAIPTLVTGRNVLNSLKRPEDSAYHGAWSVEGGRLRNLDHGARLALPVIPNGNFKLSADFERVDGNESVIFTIPVGSANAMVWLSGDAGNQHGLGDINGRHHNETTVRPGTLDNGIKYTLRIRVQTRRSIATIQAHLNGRRLFDWKGPTTALSSPKEWTPPDRRKIGIGVTNAKYEFSSLDLRMLNGKAIEER